MFFNINSLSCLNVHSVRTISSDTVLQRQKYYFLLFYCIISISVRLQLRGVKHHRSFRKVVIKRIIFTLIVVF